MNYTLHLTENCNLNCKYCYQKKIKKELKFDDIKSIIDIESKKDEKKSTICFFGGEPLLRKDIVYKTIEYAKKVEKDTGFKFKYQMNTNGTLLDAEFLNCIKENNIHITYSIDGNEYSHNLNRITKDGKTTYDIVVKNAKKLLEIQPYATAMMVITTNTLDYISKNVQTLFNIGFKYIICAIDYTANWDDNSLEILKEEYQKLSDIYYEKTLNEDSFYLMPFEGKMDSHINKKDMCKEMCQLGLTHVNIGADGNIYPCTQFVGIEEYIIGNCKTGIDKELQKKLMLSSGKEYNVCSKCGVRNRCRHTCGCLNLLTSGNINTPSPLICETEKMIIEIADKLAEKLYKKKSTMFIQKKYNKLYPLIDMFEESR